MSALSTIPASTTMATSEQLPLGFQTQPYLTESSDTAPTSPNCVLTDVTTPPGTAVSLADSPTVDGTVITQVIQGSALEAGHTYLLAVTFTGNESGAIWTMVLQVNCAGLDD